MAGKAGEQAKWTLEEALRGLLTATKFKGAPEEINGVLCYEARVPVEFVIAADAALARDGEA